MRRAQCLIGGPSRSCCQRKGGQRWALKCSSSAAGQEAEAQRIPVVNVAALRDQGQNAERRRRQIGEELVAAASEVGFFYVTEHGVSEALLEEARGTSRGFFHLPAATKESLSIWKEPSRRGYQSMCENITQGRPDQHEAFDLYRDMPPITAAQGRSPTMHGLNPWPTAELPGMQGFIEGAYAPAMLELGATLTRGIALGLGLKEGHFERFFTSSFWCVRLLRYPPISPSRSSNDGVEVEGGTMMGCGTHTDYGILTMLNQDVDETKDHDHDHCLQAQMRDGQWASVPPKRGAIAVNVGDMLAQWTGGMLRATPHRVLSPPHRERVAVPFFFEPNYDAVIEPLDLQHLLSEEGGVGIGEDQRQRKSFPPIQYGDHLLRKVSTNFKT